MRNVFLIAACCFIWTVLSCSPVTVDIEVIRGAELMKTYYPVSLSFLYEDGLIHDQPRSIGEENAIKKALQLALIEWTPSSSVPCIYGNGRYAGGLTVHGIPYSSVKHLNNFIGLDISFHTFMTAIDNPRSYIYTENVRNAPYYGTFCAPYYGTVCSTSVMYALGSEIPYFTDFILTEDVFVKEEKQNPESIQLCDILWSGGHEVLVVDIGRNEEGEIKSVAILESGTTHTKDTSIMQYYWDDFKERWKSSGWVRYRYKYTDDNTIYSPCEYVVLPGETSVCVLINRPILTRKGDAAPYRDGEKIVIDSFDQWYSKIQMNRDGVPFRTYDYKDVLEINNLPVGEYAAYLIKDDQVSSSTVFEVINTDVKVSGDNPITVTFSSSNARPVYICICENDANKPLKFIPLTQEDISTGRKQVELPVSFGGTLYCKVLFAGKFGRVSNVPIRLN